MFSAMLEGLRRGELPSPAYLQIRLKPAIIKKSGVLQQPRPCWSSDPKINPDSAHMLWAAILLGDQEQISLMTGMLFDEQGYKSSVFTPEKARALLVEKSAGLLALAPANDFRDILKEKIDEAADSISRATPPSPR